MIRKKLSYVIGGLGVFLIAAFGANYLNLVARAHSGVPFVLSSIKSDLDKDGSSTNGIQLQPTSTPRIEDISTEPFLGPIPTPRSVQYETIDLQLDIPDVDQYTVIIERDGKMTGYLVSEALLVEKMKEVSGSVIAVLNPVSVDLAAQNEQFDRERKLQNEYNEFINAGGNVPEPKYEPALKTLPNPPEDIFPNPEPSK